MHKMYTIGWTSAIFLMSTCYAAASILQYRKIREQTTPALPLLNQQCGTHRWLVLWTSTALLAHAGLLYHWIDGARGQNLTVTHMFSCTVWLMACWMAMGSRIQSLSTTSMLILPLAALSAWGAYMLPGHPIIVQTVMQPKLLLHVLLSMITLSMLLTATLQAILLALQHQWLHARWGTPWLHWLPPLQTTEKLLFQMLTITWLFLGLEVLSSFYCFTNQQHHLLSHIPLLLTTGSWFMLTILLTGHYHLGWRSLKAAYSTWIGCLLVIMSMMCGCGPFLLRNSFS